jgi:RimJ/RimL family protein N-acetyltransferase
MPGPAYRVHTSRLVLRCWSPTDAPLLVAAVTASREHLLPWMPWAEHEPESLDDKVRRLRGFRAEFDRDRDFIYGIFSRDESEVIGGTGLHPRVGEGGRDIGYWIHTEHLGRGYATEAAAAMTRVGFEVEGLRRVEIHCDPRNERSLRVTRKLGFTHEATLRSRSVTAAGEARDTMIWSLLREDYAGTPAAAAEVEAFDVLNRRLL